MSRWSSASWEGRASEGAWGSPLSPSALSQDYVCWRERCNFHMRFKLLSFKKRKIKKVLNVCSQSSAAPKAAEAFASSLPGEDQRKWEVGWSWQCMCASVSVCMWYSALPEVLTSQHCWLPVLSLFLGNLSVCVWSWHCPAARQESWFGRGQLDVLARWFWANLAFFYYLCSVRDCLYISAQTCFLLHATNLHW